MIQTNSNETNILRTTTSARDTQLEKITRAILKSIKDEDASRAGGVRTDMVRKIIVDELKKDKAK